MYVYLIIGMGFPQPMVHLQCELDHWSSSQLTKWVKKKGVVQKPMIMNEGHVRSWVKIPQSHQGVSVGIVLGMEPHSTHIGSASMHFFLGGLYTAPARYVHFIIIAVLVS
ncbi:hypothetical protein BU17DRAFT_68348 [Hysterangium stoloniferum]|nr:hypothetical protein BU17DRAFT_68348 [Hysterangium stoloniferum]